MKKTALFIIGIFIVGTGLSQVKTPDASPKSVLHQVVGLTDIEVVYSRPSIKERVIFGDLVPYNELWRTGANAATTIEFSSDVTFGNTPVKYGKYALYTIPGANEWKVLLYADYSQWGAPGKNYDASKIVAEATVTPEKISPKLETFTISFDDLKNSGAFLTLAWDTVLVKIPIEVNSKDVILESITKTMSGPTGGDYHRAATYYFEENIDLDKALEWSTKAEELSPNAYWVLKLKSDIQAAKKEYKNAVKTAKKALDLAQKAGNKNYVSVIQDNISVWEKQ